MKSDTTYVRMRSDDHHGDLKCRKRAPRSVEFNSFIKVARDSFGSNKMCQSFCQNLLFMAHAVRKWNNTRGSPCSLFQKMGPNIAIFDLLKYGVNWKTVTCLPLGRNFDNFENYKFCNFLSQDSLWTIERDKRKISICHRVRFGTPSNLSHFHPCRPTFMQYPA